jgi:hypothetical protein
MSDERLYGNWLRPQRLSIRGIGLRTAAIAVTGYLAGLVVLQYDLRAGLAILAGCGLLTLAAGIRIGGTTVTGWVTDALRWRWAQHTGTTVQRAQQPDGSRQLPGPLARTRLLDLTSPNDDLGGGVGAVHDPVTRRITVTMKVAATGADLTDTADQDAAVARWERWLESLGRRPDIAFVQVTVETAPQPGTQLAAQIRRRLAPSAPQDCRALMTNLATDSPALAARTDTRISVTFDLRAWDHQAGRAGRRDGVRAYLPPLGRAVADLHAGLDGCGITVLGPATADELSGTMLAAFDPARAGAIDWVLASRKPDLPTWADLGPATAREYRDAYRHDSSTSASFVWAQAPRQLVPSTVLAAIARPGRFRKRVTVTYVATPASAAMDAATAQVRGRWLAQSLSQLPVIGRATTAQDERDAAAAEQATREVAAGAGWIAQTLLVTTTVLDERRLQAAVTDLEHAAGTSQLRLSRLYELQAFAFYAGLPVGQHLPELARRWTR